MLYLPSVTLHHRWRMEPRFRKAAARRPKSLRYSSVACEHGDQHMYAVRCPRHTRSDFTIQKPNNCECSRRQIRRQRSRARIVSSETGDIYRQAAEREGGRRKMNNQWPMRNRGSWQSADLCRADDFTLVLRQVGSGTLRCARPPEAKSAKSAIRYEE